MLNIFHVSDLHFSGREGTAAREAACAAISGILGLAQELKAEGVISPKVCVFITGDLVHSGTAYDDGDTSDFDGVHSEFLEPLTNLLGIGADRVFIVPGNHEMDRNSIDEEKQICASNYHSKSPTIANLNHDLRSKLSNYFDFIDRHGYVSPTRHSPRLVSVEIEGQSIACFNCLAGAYSKKNTGDKGELFVTPTEMQGELSSLPNFPIVLMHHPLSWFDDKCGVDLKSFLASKRARLVTGHIHDAGLDWAETETGSLATLQAGASAENGREILVSVAWLPKSDSAALRHYKFDIRKGAFEKSPVAATKVAPSSSRNFFQRSAAFFSINNLKKMRDAAEANCAEELASTFGKSPEKYVTPDLVEFPVDQFSGRRISPAAFQATSGHRVISGEELSGKSSFVHFMAMESNRSKQDNRIHLVFDYRSIKVSSVFDDVVTRKLASYAGGKQQAEYLIETGLVHLWFDNFDSESESRTSEFIKYFDDHPAIQFTIAVRGSARYVPSRAPTLFPEKGVTYFGLSEISLNTALKIIESRAEGTRVEKPRALVERAFRSANNLNAPRTAFYIGNLIDIYLSDGAVEPLNRYLLIENLLSEKIRSAHKIHLPGHAIDMEMIETFIGQLAYHLVREDKPFLTKGEYHREAENFIERKGLQRKRFDPDHMLQILNESYVLREYDGGFGFMMTSIEDYFLAKHMGRDHQFRDEVLTVDGLLAFPTVAEYYVAQNPSETVRIESVFQILEEFESEVWETIENVSALSRKAIECAAPGNPSAVQEQLLEIMGELEEPDDTAIIVSERPQRVGNTNRLKFSVEDRGAVFLQLGSSILGVTRTLDQEDRIKIFERLRRLMLISFLSVPLVAQHLADGGEITIRGSRFHAEYTGPLSKQDDRFYIILRSMIYNVFRNFATWSGSPSFFKAAATLRKTEDDELIRSALLAQNIEADLTDSIDFIETIDQLASSPVLQEILIRLYLDAMSLVPLERRDEQKAIDLLVDAAVKLSPKTQSQNARQLKVQKDQLRRAYTERIGVNAYVGKLVRKKRTKN